MDPQTASRIIKEEARALGFSFCGISKASFLEEEAPCLEQWLREGKHGTMRWMENHFDKRLDPTLLVPGAKSVVTVLYNYYTEKKQEDIHAPKISRYAYGEDYHHVIKDKLKLLLENARTKIGALEGRAFVDSAPVMERAWAKKSGMGWIGKHSLLINKQKGSYFFIGELILDLEMEPDGPIKDFCGTCTACIDACPTDAITPYWIDSNKCISYLTIELRENISPEFREQMNNWAFGCDICQEVCPWNRFAEAHTEPGFQPLAEFLGLRKEDWKAMDEKTFKQLFKRTPLMRAGFEKIRETIRFIEK